MAKNDDKYDYGVLIKDDMEDMREAMRREVHDDVDIDHMEKRVVSDMRKLADMRDMLNKYKLRQKR